MWTLSALGCAGSVEGGLHCLVDDHTLLDLWCGEIPQNATMWAFVGNIDDCRRLFL